ncbi:MULTISPECIES: nucleotidyltransferase domain-containing protein [Haloferax]|uniref:HTH domain-containing protein n=1 Tax=Haloferax marinum TaxID=2666143 RepID=A0A6A8GB47_9EURY|nr:MULTISPECIES: nucleotidyltransferase domain-containing protein [Haloferax]KAB1190775.1 HTH domain-containing protein [Haloferax sp. CBA1150]MRW98314.1 HTH domain-containing protein [Haloferax marinum]
MFEETKQDARVCLRVSPGDDTKIFRLRAADDVLRLLVDAHESEYTMSELAAQTDHSRSTIWRAVGLLDELGVLKIRETAQRKYVGIDPAHLQKDDPILAIEQVEYHDPLRAFVQRVESAIETVDDVDQVLGVLVFGSVARGEADRKSDIDVFVLVDGDRTVARRLVSEIADDLGEERFEGDRYTFEPFVESTESARRAGEKLRAVFDEGVTIRGGKPFQDVRTEVLLDER